MHWDPVQRFPLIFCQKKQGNIQENPKWTFFFYLTFLSVNSSHISSLLELRAVNPPSSLLQGMYQ